MKALHELAAVLFLVFGITQAALAETQVVFTVDVESQATPLLAQVDAVCEDGSVCGLMEIARMFAERGLAATFFLNVFEYRTWGEAPMRDIVTRLQAAGQDVALHTHPQFAYDPLRNEMYQYNLAEQTTIIRDGVKLLQEWTGLPVVAHRAGDYSANEDTLEALRRNGVRVDSSYFLGHPRCRLDALGLPSNMPSFIDGLTEFPVTVYERAERPEALEAIFPPVSSIRKIDVNWMTGGDEVRSAIDAVIKAKIPYLVVFLHSFSLLTPGNGSTPVADVRARKNFQALLDHVSERGLQVVTMRDLADAAPRIATAQAQDIVPRVSVGIGIHRYVWKQMRRQSAGHVLGVVLLVTVFVGGGTLLIVYRRIRAKGH